LENLKGQYQVAQFNEHDLGANLTNEQKRAHLTGIKRDHLIDDIIVVEVLPPE
jgi:hypothetical protein